MELCKKKPDCFLAMATRRISLTKLILVMETKLMQLEGIYQRKGKKLVKENLTLLLSERKETTEKRSKYFLISLRGNQKDSYISSLYEDESAGWFWFEYKGINYSIYLSDDSASVSFRMQDKRA